MLLVYKKNCKDFNLNLNQLKPNNYINPETLLNQNFFFNEVKVIRHKCMPVLT